MLNNLIAYFLKNRFITIILACVIIFAGIFSIYKTPVDALPDLSENQVIIVTQWSGQSPQNIEDQITYPLTVGMQGVPKVKTVRSSSMLGVSMVTVIFTDNTDIYFARDRVSEKLREISMDLPMGVQPMLGPDASGLGHIFMYTIENENMNLTELRSLQDFNIKYELQSLAGISEVASVGGYEKTYQIILDPIKTKQYGLKISAMMTRLDNLIFNIKMSNQNVSGGIFEHGEREIAIEGLGFFQNEDDLRNLVVGKKKDNSILLLSEVANVRIGGKNRRGILADKFDEKVGGIVVMRYGENPLNVIKKIREKIIGLEKNLPEGTKIIPFYDRTELIENSISTLKLVLIQMLIITTIVLWLFLRHTGATMITGIALLFGVLINFLLMYLFKIPSNIMSLGGIAIAIGTMVDSIIVITENAYQKLVKENAKNFKDRLRLVFDSTKEVASPLLFAILIIILSFSPILALEGIEGKLFHPLAFTNMFSMLGALLVSILLVPLGCSYFLKGKLYEDKQIPTVFWFQKIYEKSLKKILKFPKKTLIAAFSLFLISLGFASQIGSEFMPPLDEGSIMYMPITVPDVSERKIRELLIETNKTLSEFPEVEKVVGKAGRAKTATDLAPLSMIETFITLKPKSEWRKGITKSKLISEMNKSINFANFWNSFTQPIIGRIDMISTGIRSQVGIKIFGDNHKTLENLSLEIEKKMVNIPGAIGVVAVRTSGLKYLKINLNEEKLANYGIPKMEVLNLISIGLGGKIIGETIEGREKYGIEVKFEKSFRESLSDVKSLYVTGLNGNEISLSEISDIKIEDGPAMIKSENGKLMSIVQMDVSGLDLGSFVKITREYLNQNLKLPSGYSLEFDGQYKNQLRAKSKLSWVVPLVILIIFILLYLAYKDLKLVSIVMLTIPLSIIGGIFSLFLAKYNFSVAVWIGFIALFGNAVETGVVIVLYIEGSVKKSIKKFGNLTKQHLHSAILEGAIKRLRPVLMTAFTSIIGLLPILITTGVGAEIQKPLAVVVIGGLFSSILMTMFVVPVMFERIRKNIIKEEK